MVALQSTRKLARYPQEPKSPSRPLASFALPKKSFLDDFLSFRDENETDIAEPCSLSEMHSKSKVITTRSRLDHRNPTSKAARLCHANMSPSFDSNFEGCHVFFSFRCNEKSTFGVLSDLIHLMETWWPHIRTRKAVKPSRITTDSSKPLDSVALLIKGIGV